MVIHQTRRHCRRPHLLHHTNVNVSPSPAICRPAQAAAEGCLAAAALSRKGALTLALDVSLLTLAAATAAVCFRGMQRDLVCSQVTRDA